MTGRDELILIAELGVAYAGFLAIFLVFARQAGRFDPTDSLSIRSAIGCGFSTIFLSLIPLVLGAFALHEPVIWRTSSAVGLLLIVLVSIDVGRAQSRLSQADRAAVGLGYYAAGWTLASLSPLLFLWNALGAPHAPSAGFHLAGLACILGIGTVNFAAVAYRRLS